MTPPQKGKSKETGGFPVVPITIDNGGDGNDGGNKPGEVKVAAQTRFQDQSLRLRTGAGNNRFTAARLEKTGGAPDLELYDSGNGEGGEETPQGESTTQRLKRKLNPAQDGKKQVGDLIKEGVFKDETQPATDAQVPQREAAERTPGAGAERFEANKPGKPPEIEVGMQDVNADPTTRRKPDFVVKADGSVEVHNNFETNLNSDRKVVIEIERKDGQTEQTPEQKAEVDRLVRYVDGRIKEGFKEAQENGVNVTDEQGLVAEQTERDLKANRTPKLDGMSDETREAVERTNRFNGSGSGSMSRDESEKYFPERYVERQDGETDKAVVLKDMVASLFNPTKDDPYGTVRKHSDGGYAVGRYGLTSGLFWDWIEGLEGFEDLGTPPDPKKLKKLLSKLKNKLPKDFLDKFDDPKFAKGFVDMLDKMKTGKGEISPQELKEFMPPQLQEAIASDLVERYSEQAKGDAGLVALAFQKGKPFSQLTDADKDSESGKQIRESGNKLHTLADKKFDANSGDSIEWSNDGGPTSRFAAKLVRAAHSADAEYNRRGVGRSGGQCAAAVQVAFNKAGWGEFLGCGDAWEMRHKMLKSGKFEVVENPGQAKQGDVILWRPASGGSVYGHIEIVTGKNNNGVVATSDFTHTVTAGQFRSNKGGYYSGSMILRPKAA